MSVNKCLCALCGWNEIEMSVQVYEGASVSVCVCMKEEREANEKEQANISHYLWYRGTKTLTGQGGFAFHLGHGTVYRGWGLITSN